MPVQEHSAAWPSFSTGQSHGTYPDGVGSRREFVLVIRAVLVIKNGVHRV